jgi:polysaccharide export outer membrane protein
MRCLSRTGTAGTLIRCLPVRLCSLATLLGLSACSATRHNQFAAFVHPNEAEVSTGHYVVRPPDAIAIHAPGIQEVDGTRAVVRPDGKITLRLLGDVDIAGLTTQEVSAKLKTLLARYYVEPEVVVEMASYRSQFYYVFGEVNVAGPRAYTGRDTLVKALAEAQPTFLAWKSQIKVIRPSSDPNETKVIVVSLDKMVRDGDISQDILLQEGDVIQVPPTPLAWVGLRIREVMYPVGPLMDAYTTPAEPIMAWRNYEGDFGDDDNNDHRRR